MDKMGDNKMKKIVLQDFLTEEQIEACIQIYKQETSTFVSDICAATIEPNMAEINRKLGQENDARYLGYAVLFVLDTANGKAIR